MHWHRRHRAASGIARTDDTDAPARSSDRTGADRIFTRGFGLLATAQTGYVMAANVVYTSLALLIVERLQLGAPAFGAYVAFQYAASLLVRPAIGGAIDRASAGGRGIRVFGAAGATASALGSALFAVVGTDAVGAQPASWTTLVLGVATLVSGIAGSVYGTAAVSQLSYTVPTTRRGEAMGYYGIFETMGRGIGAGTSFVVYQDWGFAAPFIVGAAMQCLTALVWLAMPAVHAPRGPAATRRFGIERTALAPSVTQLCLQIGQASSAGFVPLIGLARGIANPGVFFIASAVGALISRVCVGRVSDQYGRLSVLVPGLLLNAAGLALVSQAGSAEALALAGLGVGFGYATGQSNLQALVVDLSARSKRGAAVATLGSAADIGVLSGALLSGQAAGALGYDGLFLAVSAMPAVGIAVLCLWRIRHRPVLKS